MNRHGLMVTSKAKMRTVGNLVVSWAVMARAACVDVLGRCGRGFSEAEINTDPLLLSEWNNRTRAEWNDTTRDVCAGVPGVPPLPRPARAR
jgi:hypothetical protein